jgi:hypothetical protein
MLSSRTPDVFKQLHLQVLQTATYLTHKSKGRNTMPQPPSGWTQQSSNALKALVRIALDNAENAPEEWINPTPLNSKVRYFHYETFDIYEAYPEETYGTIRRTGRTIRWDRSGAAGWLLGCWFRELCSDDSNKIERNIEFVKLLTLNNEIGLWT